MRDAPKPHYIHATALMIGESGILISGRSKAGKSSLAETLIAACHARGIRAALIGDDRIGLTLEEGRLLARPHPAIAGLIERRGSGIHAVEYVPVQEVCLEIALQGHNQGAPVQEDEIARLPGHRLRRCIVAEKPDPAIVLPLVLARQAQ